MEAARILALLGVVAWTAKVPRDSPAMLQKVTLYDLFFMLFSGSLLRWLKYRVIIYYVNISRLNSRGFALAQMPLLHVTPGTTRRYNMLTASRLSP